MARDGVSIATIAAYFGVNSQEFKRAFYEARAAGNAELNAIIAQNSVEYEPKSNIPVAKN